MLSPPCQVAEELQDIARIAPAAGGDKSEADEIADFNRRMKEKLKEVFSFGCHYLIIIHVAEHC